MGVKPGLKIENRWPSVVLATAVTFVLLKGVYDLITSSGKVVDCSELNIPPLTLHFQACESPLWPHVVSLLWVAVGTRQDLWRRTRSLSKYKGPFLIEVDLLIGLANRSALKRLLRLVSIGTNTVVIHRQYRRPVASPVVTQRRMLRFLQGGYRVTLHVQVMSFCEFITNES